MQQCTIFTAVAQRPHPVWCNILEDHHYTTRQYWALVITMNVYINARDKSTVQYGRHSSEWHIWRVLRHYMTGDKPSVSHQFTCMDFHADFHAWILSPTCWEQIGIPLQPLLGIKTGTKIRENPIWQTLHLVGYNGWKKLVVILCSMFRLITAIYTQWHSSQNYHDST